MVVILGSPTPDQKVLNLVFVQCGIWETTANQRAGQLCEEDTCLVWCSGGGSPHLWLKDSLLTRLTDQLAC